MKKLLFRLTVIGLILFLGLFIYLRFGAYIFIDKQQRLEITDSIKASPSLPQRFYELYEVANPKSLNTGFTENMTREIIGKLTQDRSYIVLGIPSYSATYLASNSWGIEREQLIYYVEDQTTQKECLNFNAQNIDFTRGNIGITTASYYYFKKPLEELNDREMVTLIIVMKNPSLYNPHRRPEKAKAAVDLIMNRLNQLEE